MLHMLSAFFFLAALAGSLKIVIDMIREAASLAPATPRAVRFSRSRRNRVSIQSRQARTVRLVPARVPA